MTEENIEIEIKEPADLMFEAKPKTPEPIAVTIPETIPEDDTVALLPKPKAKKPRKPMSAEHKKKVLEALARGRATTKAKKLAKEKAKDEKKAAKLANKKIEKEEVENILEKSLVEKSKKTKELESENLKLKEQLLTLQDVMPKPKPKATAEPPAVALAQIPQKKAKKVVRVTRKQMTGSEW